MFKASSVSKASPVSAPRNHRPSIRAARPRARARASSAELPAELVAQVRIQAMVVDPLQSTQCRLVHAGRPERQPGLHRRTIDLAVVEVAFDDRSQVRPRTVVVERRAAFAYGLAQGAEQVPHGRFQQAVLVLEVVADDAVGNTRQAGNQRCWRLPCRPDRPPPGWRESVASGGWAAYRPWALLSPLVDRCVRAPTDVMVASLFCFY